MLKYDASHDLAFVQLRKDAWTVPREAQMNLNFYIDNSLIWTKRFSGTDTPNMIEELFTLPEAAGFMKGFVHGRKFEIQFASGTERPWTGSLAGPRAVQFYTSDRP